MGDVAAAVIFTSDYARRDVELKMAEVRNESNDVTVENMHRHIESGYC
jgi:metal-responsive CopG/Arc/MetJ family transcriptional regulator